MSIQKPISSLLPCEDCNGANFHMPVPHLDVRNPVPKTAVFPGLKQEHMPPESDPQKSFTKGIDTTPKKTHVPRTYG